MSLQYATEDIPLGTAGSVKNAEDALRDAPFLVISGDALTDIDLSDLVRFHKDSAALVTVALARVPDPLEFGIVIADADGRIQRFLEKPTWGQVFSDTVNTGIYVMEPEVLAQVPPGRPSTGPPMSSPSCLTEARRSTAGSPTGTGRTSARTRPTIGSRPTCCPARSRPTSTVSRCRRASGWPRAPRLIPTPSSPGRCASATTPRSRPARSCASSPWSAATSWSRRARSCTAPPCTTTCTSGSAPPCAAA